MATLSPEGWLPRLEKRIDDRWFSQMGVFDAYYEGDHKLTFATAKFREAFGALFGALADNWMQIVVNSPVERLKVQGFRFGRKQDADDDAWAIWQANGLDAESNMVHTEAVKLGESYWLVTPPLRVSDDPPRITSEHPSQMIVACAPGDRKKRLAALKKWRGDDGYGYATLYLPETIHKYQSRRKLADTAGAKVQWAPRRDDPGGDNPLGEVPVIPIYNSPSMLRGGSSDLAGGPIAIQNAVNKLLCDMLVGSEYQAFPQRVLMGVDIPKDDNGQPVRAAELQSSQSRLWTFASADAKAFEFSASDLQNYTKAMETLVQHLAAQTRTPPHYVIGEIVNASGDALKAAETGLVSKVRDKMPAFEEGHEEMMRLAFKSMGNSDRASETSAETIWKDPESRSDAELADALTKLAAIGVPQEILWERYGFSPVEIDRMRGMQETEALLAQANQPPVPANGAVPPEQAKQVVAST